MGIDQLQPIPVELPSGELIRPHDFAVAIANVSYPEKTEGLIGMECVVRKRAKTSATYEQSREYPEVLTVFEGNTWCWPPYPTTQGYPEIPPDSKENKWLWFPFALSKEDREELEPLLSSLPPLKYPMSDDELSWFRDAYWALPQRPSWVPILITNDIVNQRLLKKREMVDKHLNQILQEIKDGGLYAVDRGHLRMHTITDETLLVRSSAIEYLKKRCGLSVKGSLNTVADACDGKRGEIKGIYTASGVEVTNKKGGGCFGIDELEAIEKFVKEEDPKTGKKKNSQRKAAELIGVDETRISQLLTDLKKLREQEAKNSHKLGFANTFGVPQINRRVKKKL